PVDVRAAVPGAGVDRRGSGSDDAEFSRDFALENRGWLRRHAQFGVERAVYHRDRRADRAAVPFLSDHRHHAVARLDPQPIVSANVAMGREWLVAIGGRRGHGVAAAVGLAGVSSPGIQLSRAWAMPAC